MKRIFVALDGSPRAPTVLAAAAQLAERCDARVVLFRAVGLPVEIPREIFVQRELDLEEILRKTALADLHRLAGGIPSELVERMKITIGTPWDSIVREARELAADLIVIGSHGYGGIDRLLGTTAAKVVNHADRNVMVVRTAL